MKRFNRIFACLLAVALLACACSGCGKKSEEPSVNGADAKNERYYAPLTGEPLSSKPANTRPFAVMINNIVFAQPQVGISNADMIYEIPAYNADHLDGVRDGNTSSMFYRDASRGQHGSEHTLFFHGANVEALVDRYKFRTEHESSYKTGLNFADNAVDQCTGRERAGDV